MRLLTTLVFLFTALIHPVALAAAPSRPNLIILLADDLGWYDVGFNGRKDWTTPNLDRLAAGGAVCKRFYAAAVVCAPSRAALMTGKYTIHNGVSGNSADLPASQITLPETLKKQGYATGLFGKWHHGIPRPGMASYRHPLDLGFNEFMGFTDAVDAWEHFPKQLFFGREKKPVKGYADTLFADHAVDFIKRHKDSPFFLYVPFTATHLHIEAPAEDLAPFKGKFAEKDPKTPINAAYAGMVTRLDKEIGRILDTLDELKLAENSLIVFASDQGATFESGNKGASNYHDSNYPFRGQKRTVWEGGIRVPAIVRWSGVIGAGKVLEEPFHMIDVFPTFLAASGGKPAAKVGKVDGIDVLEVWKGKAKAPARTLFWEWQSEGYNQLAAMRGDLKLVVTGNNPPELFDVVSDPAERRSVYYEHSKLAETLRQELSAWLATETEESKWGRNPIKPVKKKPIKIKH